MFFPSFRIFIVSLFIIVKGFCFPHERENGLNCPTLTFCKCSIGTNYEIACPNRINTVITLRVEPQQETNRVEIECNSDDSVIFDYLPEWNIGASDVVKFNGCPFPLNATIQSVFNRLGIQNVRSLIFFAKNSLTATTTTLISTNAVAILPQPLFNNLSNVLSLDLRSNNMRLPLHIFHSLRELEFLQISSTNLSNSMDGIFQHLTNLKRLNLWNNDLKNITKQFFVGISSITDLEMSSNDIGTLTAAAFEPLISIESINLNSNRLDELPGRLFNANKALQRVRISSNHLMLNVLPNELFARLPQLDTVWINDCNFTILPEDLFIESINLRNISLANNNLREIPATIFRHQINLLSLDLSNNDLRSLDDGLFDDTSNLSILYLSYNHLSNISTHLLSGLSNLQELYIDNNNLHTIHMTALDGTDLRVLHLQNNFLDFQNIDGHSLDVEKISPFQNLHNLQVLNMRNNSMQLFLSDWNIVNVALTELDLSYNQIKMINFGNIFNIWMEAITINISHNQITRMNAARNSVANENQSPVTWILNHNPLNCDCMVIHFASYLRNQLQNSMNMSTTFVTDELKCSTPHRFAMQQLQNVPLTELTCPLDKVNATEKQCPDGCSCFVRTIDSTAVFNCSNANLTKMPALPHIKSLGLKFYELYIENNNISAFPLANTTGYQSVNRIFAKNNSVATILAEHLPNNLFALDLSGNKLKRINPAVLMKLNHMQNLQNVSFSRNPWICDCAAYELMKFIETHFTKMVGINEITCDNNKSMTLISRTGLCPIGQTTILIICVLIVTMFAIILLLTTIYYKNQQEIMVWMFAHHKFAWFFNNKPKSDDHKKYDVFILCSTTDEIFVLENLMPQLKSGPNGFKVCPLLKDCCQAGDIVVDPIVNCVEESRQTIVFLTPNFIDCFTDLNKQTEEDTIPDDRDIWGLMGFRIAHKNALDEKRRRVIIITKGDIGCVNRVQAELKAYLKTNIYFRWGEKRFFDRLRLAIAHPKYFKTDKRPVHIDHV